MYAWKYVWYGLGQLYELQIMGIELYKELKYTEISVKPKNVENSNRRDHFIYIPKDKQLYTQKKKGGGLPLCLTSEVPLLKTVQRTPAA